MHTLGLQKGPHMPLFDTRQIATLVSQLGGDRQAALERLASAQKDGLAGLVDTGRHAHLLRTLGVSPLGLASGQYDEQLTAQQADGSTTPPSERSAAPRGQLIGR